jgi:hypothetical protein
MSKTLYEKLTDAGRTGIGTTLQVASFHPALNIPYVGTGLGGALFEAGSAIKDKKPAKEVLKDAGRGFIIGETVGAIPYVGKGINKVSGGRIGNALDDAGRYIANTKVGQTVGNYAQSAGNAINKGLESAEDFINTKLRNKQIVYHGSPKDFNKFDNAYIGTGEGAQAHGYGHYSGLNKNVIDKRYRKRLTTSSKEEVAIDNKYKPLFDKAEKKYDELLNDLYKQKQEGKITEDFYQNAIDYSPEAVEMNNILSEWQKEVALLDGKKLTPNTGQLYKLSIPKDDVLLREDLLFREQPKAVQNAIKKMYEENYKKYPHNSELMQILYTDNMAKSNKGVLGYKEGRNLYGALSDMTGSPQEASNLLNKYGIKGISYNGGMDGEARVIFNPDDIEIVRKYYNQPLLSEKIMDNINWGTGANALYDYLMDK